MCDSIDCPICEISLSDDYNIDLNAFEVDENTTIHCKDCDLKLNFKLVQV
ncbi:MAG: hypothetical protein M9958_02215 [Chitinophagales bacterium]|nr:hypothetical protein [Chitinophagales bacterium]